MKGNINEQALIDRRQEIGVFIREFREEKGLSQQALADDIGINRTTVSKIEAGKWNYGIDTLVLFGTHLGFKLVLRK